MEGPTADNAYCIIAKAMNLKELLENLRDRIIARHRSGETYKKITLKVPQTVGSIIHKCTMKFCYNRYSSKRGDQDLMVTMTAPEILCGYGTRVDSLTFIS